MSMSEKQRGEEFPVHIDLGTEPGKDCCAPAPAATKKGEKPKKYYPTLYVSGVKNLSDIPQEGCMLIDYRVVGFNNRDEKNPSIEIECRTMCLPPKEDDGDENPDEVDGARDMIDDMARKAGVKTKDEE